MNQYNSFNSLIGLDNTTYLQDENKSLLQLGPSKLSYQTGTNQIDALHSPSLDQEFKFNSQGQVHTITESGKIFDFEYNAYTQKAEKITIDKKSVISYYDIQGNRVIRESSDEQTEIFFYSKEALFPLLIINKEGDESINIINQGQTICTEHSNNKFYAHSDHLKSLRCEVDETGNVVSKTAYTAYGELISDEGERASSYLFTGQYYDTLLKLYHFNRRLYAPQLGAFLSMDEANQSYSPYLYCAANPIKFIDEDGKMFAQPQEASSPPPLADPTQSPEVDTTRTFDEIFDSVSPRVKKLFYETYEGYEEQYEQEEFFNRMLMNSAGGRVESSVPEELFDDVICYGGYTFAGPYMNKLQRTSSPLPYEYSNTQDVFDEYLHINRPQNRIVTNKFFDRRELGNPRFPSLSDTTHSHPEILQVGDILSDAGYLSTTLNSFYPQYDSNRRMLFTGQPSYIPNDHREFTYSRNTAFRVTDRYESGGVFVLSVEEIPTPPSGTLMRTLGGLFSGNFI